MPYGDNQVNTFTAKSQYSPSISHLANGGWVVTWASYLQDGSGAGVYQQVFDANGMPVGAETQVNTTVEGDQDMPIVKSLADGGWIVAWGGQGVFTPGIHLQVYNADGTPRGEETQVNTNDSNPQGLRTLVPLADGGWVVNWISNGQDGSGAGIYQQAFHADGSKLGAETQVNTYTAGNQFPGGTHALDDGGWVVVWTSEQDGSNTGIYQQAYNADGSVRGGETQVNSYSPSYQGSPSIEMRSDGGWVVIWESLGQDGSGYGIYQQAYHADGTQAGAETLVNTTTEGTQAYHASTSLDDGGWVVIWLSPDQDTGMDGIFQQVFNGDGVAQGGETRVDSTDFGHRAQSVTALADGGWVVTWVSVGYAEEYFRIYQQAFHADGTENGNQTLVNTQTESYKDTPQVAALEDGGWIVSWASSDQDFYDSGIYQVRYDSNAQAVSLPSNEIYGDFTSQTLIGTGGDDAIYGLSGDDVLIGGNGNDFLDGGSGDDQMIGGLGDDRYVVFSSGDTVVEQAGQGIDTVYSEISLTLSANVENLYLIADGDLNATGNGLDNILRGNRGFNTLTGGGGNDVLYGLEGRDTLYGGAGNDKLYGGSDEDVLVGGTGDDTYYIFDDFDTIEELAGEGVDTVHTKVQNYTLTENVENLVIDGTGALNVFGNDLANVITGNSGRNVIYAGAGNDRIYSNGGDDWIDGGAGADTFYGGSGNNGYVFDNGGDKVIGEIAGGGTDTIWTSVTVDLRNQSAVENLRLTGTSDINGTGNELDNLITGNSGRNVIFGGAGNDRIYSNGGDDRLDGGEGADIFVGGTGNTTYFFDNVGDKVISEVADGGADTIWSSVTVDLRKQSAIENLRLTGTGNINGTGNELKNLITGNASDNVVAGGSGIDSLYGKGGSDTFAFSHKGTDNKDSIWDFDSDDRIRLDASVFTGLAKSSDGSLSASSFAFNKAVGTSAQIVYNKATGILSYDSNGAAADGADDIAFVGKNLAFFDQQDIFIV